MSLPFPAPAAGPADDVRLLAELSHEIRTPMTALLGYVELLLDPSGPATHPSQSTHDMLRIVQQSGQHVLELVQSVLDWAKLDIARPAHWQTISPEALCEETIAWLRPRVSPTVKLHCVTHDSAPRCVKTDAPRLRQILLNLLGNALKFTTHGEVRIELSGQNRFDQAWLIIEVHDTGIGMTEAELASLFTSFSPGSHAACDAGLGLAISRRLCRALGGNLVAESTLHQGSVFRVELPCPAHPVARSTTLSAATNGVAIPTTGALAGRRILLADDSVESRRLIAFFLRQAGAAVVEAQHGLEACDLVLHSSAAFDLLLLDLHMPLCDGIKATKQLRAANWSGPIVALTAADAAADVARCFESGFDDVACKPIDRARLISLAERWVKSSPAGNMMPCIL